MISEFVWISCCERNPPITRTMSDKDAVEEALRNIEKLEKQVEANATDKKGMIAIVKIFDE